MYTSKEDSGSQPWGESTDQFNRKRLKNSNFCWALFKSSIHQSHPTWWRLLYIDVSPQGCRTALICHLAIQHEELKEVRWWCFQNTEETQIENSIKRAGSLSLWIDLRGVGGFVMFHTTWQLQVMSQDSDLPPSLLEDLYGVQVELHWGKKKVTKGVFGYFHNDQSHQIAIMLIIMHLRLKN